MYFSDLSTTCRIWTKSPAQTARARARRNAATSQRPTAVGARASSARRAGRCSRARRRRALGARSAGAQARTRTRVLPAKAHAPPTEPVRSGKSACGRGMRPELRLPCLAHAPGFQTSRRYHSSAASELCAAGQRKRVSQRQRVGNATPGDRTDVSSTGSKITRASDAMARDAGRAVSS